MSPAWRTCSTWSRTNSTFVDLERDATSHAISMPSEEALEYTVTNTDMRPSPKYRITNSYIADPSRDSLLIVTRFESLDGGVYKLYLLANPSMAGGGANNKVNRPGFAGGCFV
jgi:glucoamylase